MTWDPEILFQVRYRGEPWRLLVCVICLNLGTGRALEGVHREIFRRWPTSHTMAIADEEELSQVLRPLGMQNRRARRLIDMSVHYSFMWDGRDPLRLPGIGKYGSDSFEMFVRDNMDVAPLDKELMRYLEWRRQGSRS